MASLKCLLILSILFICTLSIINDSLTNQYVLINQDTYVQCSAKNTTFGVETGENIFQQANVVQQSVQQLMITGWYMLKSEWPYSLQLLEIKSSNSSIFKISYNIVVSEFNFLYKSNSDTRNPSQSLDQISWYYIKIQLIQAENIASQDEIRVSVMKSQASILNYLFQQAPPLGYPTIFDRSEFRLIYGFDYLPQTTPCAIIRYPWSDSSLSQYHRKQSLDTFLLWDFDFFYSQFNPQILLSSGSEQIKLSAPELSQTNPIQIAKGQYQKLNLLDTLIQSGLIIYFEFRIDESLNALQLIAILNQSGSMLNLYIDPATGHLFNYNQKYGSYYDSGLHPIVGKWYQLGEAGIIQFGSSDFSYSSTSRIKFGDSSNQIQFSLDNIRIYSGTFVNNSTSCFLMTARKQRHCLICQPGYYLSYQDNMECVVADISARQKKILILDWNRTDCPPEMLYSIQSGSCICRNKYYQSGNQCLPCQEYCSKCTNGSFCTESDQNRDTLGVCNPGYFDDGYDCISGSFSIPYRQNLAKLLPAISAVTPESQFQLNNNEIYWTSINNSLFISFFLNLMPSTTNYQQVVFYILEDQVKDILFGMINLNMVGTTPSFTFCFLYLPSNQCYLVPQVNIWIGLWIGPNSFTTFVGYKGQTIIQEQSITYKKFNNLVICIGKCTTLSFGMDIFQGTLKARKVAVIKDITYSPGQTKSFLFLNGVAAIMCARFEAAYSTISNPTITSLNQIQTISNTASLTLQIINGAALGLKGFSVQTGGTLQINSFTFEQYLSITMSVFVESLSEDTQFFVFKMNTIEISYFFVQRSFDDNVAIRICVNNNKCNTTTYSKFKMNTASFLAILIQNVDQGSSTITYLEFDIVCNYKREQFTRQINVADVPSSIINMSMAQATASVYSFNNLQFFVNNDFYFDYTPTDPCFIYYNIEDMKCIKPKKKGDALYKGIIVPKDDCSLFSTAAVHVIYNRYTQECLEIKQEILGCKTYSDDLKNCEICKDKNADPENCLVCKDGYYLDTINTGTCQACHPKCLTCGTVFDKCTVCKYAETLAPDCECQQANQFLNLNFECQNCSPKCASCSDSADNCSSCSEGRISSPICQCDPNYYVYTLPTAEVCTPIPCSHRCATCMLDPDNCLTCANGFDNPPSCQCQDGHYEYNQECLPCQAQQFVQEGSSQCSSCDKNCKSCSGTSTTCTECYDSLFLVGSKCLCSDLSLFSISSTGEILCSSYIEVSLKVELSNSVYDLVFTFDSEIQQINYEAQPIGKLINIYISKISEENFTIQRSEIEGKTLRLSLKFLTSFSATSGYASFLLVQPFVSSDGTKTLNKQYLTTPLKFSIGPLLIASSEFQSNQQLESMNNAIKNSNSVVLTFLRQFQIIFYVLNTLQPCMAFLMVKITLPPNLYQFLQFIGLLIFPTVPDYSVVVVKEEYDILGFKLIPDTDYSENQSEVFRRFTFCNELLVNNLITTLTTLAWPFMLLITHICISVSITSKILTYAPKAAMFCLKKINDNCEVALLILSTGIFNQFLNLNQEQYLNRLSFYSAIVILLILLSQNISNYLNLGSDAIKANGGYSDSNPYLALVNKLDFQSRPVAIRRYFMFQQARKYLLAAIIVFFEEYPSVVSIFSSILFLSSIIVSLILRPYKSIWGNVSKIGGEACLASSWLIFLIKFVPFQKYFQKETIISSKEVESFLQFGSAVLVILLLFNMLYLGEFLWVQVICKIINFIKQKKAPLKPVENQVIVQTDVLIHEFVHFTPSNFKEKKQLLKDPQNLNPKN